MPDEEKVGIVCGPVDETPDPVGNSVVRWCELCACEVWVAPSSLAFMERQSEHKRIEIVCTNCMDGIVETMDAADIRPVPGAERANDPRYRQSVRAAQWRWGKQK